MDLIKAMYNRHVVRHYDDKPITGNIKKQLESYINKLNKQYDMHIQLVTNEPKAFTGGKANWSNFTGCRNYLAIVGPKSKDLKEKAGYVGEMIVLKAQQLGLNSCWALLTYNNIKSAYKVNKDEKLVIMVALGKGTTSGKPHIGKRFYQVCPNRGKLPAWFIKGVKYALLAPTGKNQQGFKIKLLDDNKVEIKNRSLCKNIDLGILKYHFELGAGKNFSWK